MLYDDLDWTWESIGLLERERTWPLDARMAMFVLEAGGFHPEITRERTLPRLACRIEATVALSKDESGPADQSSLADAIIYIRDFNPGHVGYISNCELPTGARVLVDLPVGEIAPSAPVAASDDHAHLWLAA